MALLQISEPGMSPAPHQQRLAVGIDLGTTNSLVATVRSGVASVLPDALGRPLLPSIVRYFPDGRVDVGYVAQARQADDPRNTIVSVKRYMGRGVKDVAHSESAPYDFVDAPGMVQLRTAAGVKSPVEVSAEILKVLKDRAELSLGGDIFGAVITVPAYFDDAQRQATKDAGRLAGLNVLRLLNEPTAAAIAYGLENASEGVYAVYDLGGGTFDLSILKLSRGVFEVIATSGDSMLGGDDFDQRVLCWIVEQTKLAPLAPRDMRLLLVKACEAKESLSFHSESRITAKLSSGELVDLTLDTETFCRITQTLVQKTLGPMRKALPRRRARPSSGSCYRVPSKNSFRFGLGQFADRLAVAPACRKCSARSASSSGATRSTTSTPTRWSRSAPRCRPTCSPATSPPIRIGCCST